ncbi:MAG: hypothetical protein PHE58_07150, partial [Candidatus Omnitrophica bacterium]|nr:hypothetical protein [Candidatus Omnitrophota bacterium]
MKRILLLMFPILLIVTFAFTIFGVVQMRFEDEKLIDDVKRKAKSVAESMELSVRHVLESQDLKSANYLVQRFETRERLQGCVIYDREGHVIAITRRFADWKNKDKPFLKGLIENKIVRGELETF